MKFRPRFRLHRWLVLLFTGSLISITLLGQVAHPIDPAQLVRQGITQYEAKQYSEAIKTWKTALPAYSKDPTNRAIVLENIARASQQANENGEAITTWGQLIEHYRRDSNLPKLSRALIEQAQIYSSIGQPRQAIALLCAPESKGECTNHSAVQLAQQLKENNILAAAYGSLGDAYRLTGDFNPAINYLNKTLELTQTNPSYRISALNGLANAYLSRARLSYRRAESAEARAPRISTSEFTTQTEADRLTQTAKDDENKAIKNLEESRALAQAQRDYSGEVRSLLSLIPIYIRNKDPLASSLLQSAIPLLEQVPQDRSRIYATIDLAKYSEDPIQAETLLKSAITLSNQLQDDRAKSFALGELGMLYERRGQFEDALKWTRYAVLAADQRKDAKDSLYLWEWQIGRLLKETKNTKPAIAAYERAVQTLEEIRSDILSTNADLQFDFRKAVEPVYRELIALRVKPEVTVSQLKQQKTEPSQPVQSRETIARVLTTIESLRLAELQNYFGNDCVIAEIRRSPNTVTTEQARIDLIQQIVANSTQNRKTAILNHILLPKQLIVVLSLPNQEPRTVSVPIEEEEMRKKITEFRQGLEQVSARDGFNPTIAQSLYKDLIKPIASYLTDIDTLLFVQDGLLRSIPMAALHDGQQYLIQKYMIVTAPSLSSIDVTPFDRSNLRALALGVTEAITLPNNKIYPALDYADDELQSVLTELPGSQRFDFRKDNIRDLIKTYPYPIIHFTTHGQFGADPQDTFLVTGDGQRLTIVEFEEILRERSNTRTPIELLMLTACQTGTGDDRAILGLAGVAIQAGVKSALASLWFINDEKAATIVQEFYHNLRQPGVSKAKAIQLAQQELIAGGTHPGYWSALILVGNWL
ncbi:MAG: CHAT domain-containing protein [Leptolyngbya sp. UWPOB_LEPTO1]|uniref:CHAT domain-containing protein n=1 Tax=Leptolyngbya sp. UWPOB_LEPTO1 TaxID=2815653 RepID=UPI001ACAEBBB|nr:CHAT domain-containing protein [Leptolyngbya sp. UWPOB_LEPTO1]MBN8564961.1 CHAT domain-containing protein [Leptolyngbya sp. UWPOB_LEPTO1]